MIDMEGNDGKYSPGAGYNPEYEIGPGIIRTLEVPEIIKSFSPKTIYLAGKITGDKNYRQKFREAEEALSTDGSIVLSPTVLPQGFNWDAYMRMTQVMMSECCVVAFLPDWEESEGAKVEMEEAKKQKKEIIFLKRVPFGFDIDDDKYIPGNTVIFYKRVM
jgi:hypothetical protein